MKKMWYIYTIEYYSVIKKNEIMLFQGRWMELEIIMLSKISHIQKVKDHMFSPYVKPRERSKDMKVEGGLLRTRRKGMGRGREDRR
jgi:hypothetical protein